MGAFGEIRGKKEEDRQGLTDMRFSGLHHVASKGGNDQRPGLGQKGLDSSFREAFKHTLNVAVERGQPLGTDASGLRLKSKWGGACQPPLVLQQYLHMRL